MVYYSSSLYTPNIFKICSCYVLWTCLKSVACPMKRMEKTDWTYRYRAVSDSLYAKPIAVVAESDKVRIKYSLSITATTNYCHEPLHSLIDGAEPLLPSLTAGSFLAASSAPFSSAEVFQTPSYPCLPCCSLQCRITVVVRMVSSKREAARSSITLSSCLQ